MKHVMLLVLVAATAACTLILNTKDVIKSCTSNAECDDDFECLENACLPIDEAGEGEGE
jgi:hypothetical protein